MGTGRVRNAVDRPRIGDIARYGARAVVVVAAVAQLAGSALAPAPATTAPSHPAAVAHHTQADLIDLDGIGAVRAAFNADHGWTRLLLTFSPT